MEKIFIKTMNKKRMNRKSIFLSQIFFLFPSNGPMYVYYINTTLEYLPVSISCVQKSHKEIQSRENVMQIELEVEEPSTTLVSS
jgi:hypothetical protein